MSETDQQAITVIPNVGAIQDVPPLAGFHALLQQRSSWRWQGRIVEAIGQSIESDGPICSVGECCEIVDGEGRRYAAEVIGFRGHHVLSMPLGSIEGVRYGDRIAALGEVARFPVGPALVGRVLNGAGAPIDGAEILHASTFAPVHAETPRPLDRVPIKTTLPTGVRAIDGMLTVGRGQRIGIFGGSGVGKSTLIGMMTRNSEADVVVVGLVGERGREVAEFLEDALGPEGRKRAVVVVSTSDESPLLRMRAALGATSIAEYFAAQGQHVLLVLDSLTRFAMAAREIGLAAGEPPTAKGYTPSVFNKIAKLVERTGQFQTGSITAFYTVLMEGDDQQDPIVDSVRSFVDGHIVLSRSLAAEGWYPPIEILDSVSRLMPAVVTAEHQKQAGFVRKMLSVYARSEDLIRIGAYKTGGDPELDRAAALRPDIRAFLQQAAGERVVFADVRAAVAALGG
jgi:flagellum-specific ATP synthase